MEGIGFPLIVTPRLHNEKYYSQGVSTSRLLLATFQRDPCNDEWGDLRSLGGNDKESKGIRDALDFRAFIVLMTVLSRTYLKDECELGCFYIDFTFLSEEII